MKRVLQPALFCAGMLFSMTMFSMSRNRGYLLRCHAFASNVNRHKQFSRISTASRLDGKKNHSLLVRGGGPKSFFSSENEANTRLHSTASPLKESNSVSEGDEFEKRVLQSLPIASGGPIPTPIKSFGGLPYQETSSTKSSLFRVVFILGGPGTKFLKQHKP